MRFRVKKTQADRINDIPSMSASRDVWLLSAVFGVRPGVFGAGDVVGTGTFV